MSKTLWLYRHGGARNRADRTSSYLTLQQANKIVAALAKAEAQTMTINRHIILHWESMGVPDRRAMAATTLWLKSFREWAGPKTAYVWTRENGDGKGSHLHLLAHIPVGKRWHGSRARRWLEKISGNQYKVGAIKTRCIIGSLSPDSPCYLQNLQKVAAYILKGVAPHDASTLGIAHKPGGLVIGKRCGTSRNIGQ